MRGRIKIGAKISQDFNSMVWPQCKAPTGSLERWKADNPNMLFDMKFDGRHVVCTAVGFGDLSRGGDYGNGKIYVWGKPDAAIMRLEQEIETLKITVNDKISEALCKESLKLEAEAVND